MRPRQIQACLASFILMLALDMAGAARAATPRTGSGRNSAEAAAHLFAHRIPRIEIRIEPEALQSLRIVPRHYVRARLSSGGVVHTNVAVKLKGARGSFRDIDDRPALTINMDRFAPGQEFHGLDKFHLNNSVQDPTLLNEIVCSELFLAAGVPTARATHARVIINHRDLGLYVLKEGYDKRFLKRHFNRADGNLYDGGFLSDIDDPLERDSGTGPSNGADLAALVAASVEPDLDRRMERLESVLDVERFLTYAAIEMLTCDWDGYIQNRNNYRLYHNPEGGRFVFIPHGMDQMFSAVDYPITPGASSTGGRGRRFRRNGLVAAGLFEIPRMQRDYTVRLGALLKKEFTVEWLGALLNRVDDRVRAELGGPEPRYAAYLIGQSRQFRERLAARVREANLQYAELAKRVPPP